ncbi:hypothetical protein L293_1603 [Acinetobacter gyllenbergii CIP 110306 = MTCC 11365]|nr:hypothetical protein L293_1603 [Acinetobacter gyllenbergii CIP 110306 = MTCC 11365]
MSFLIKTDSACNRKHSLIIFVMFDQFFIVQQHYRDAAPLSG